MALTKEQEAVYYAAIKADERFSHELRRVYGKKSGEMRYRPNLWTDRGIKAAALHAKRAKERWLKIMRSFRTSNPTMKIKPEDYETLRAMLAGSGISSATTMRERWDALWRAKGAGEFINNKLYKYMNDDQIDTALRKIASEKNPMRVHNPSWHQKKAGPIKLAPGWYIEDDTNNFRSVMGPFDSKKEADERIALFKKHGTYTGQIVYEVRAKNPDNKKPPSDYQKYDLYVDGEHRGVTNSKTVNDARRAFKQMLPMYDYENKTRVKVIRRADPWQTTMDRLARERSGKDRDRNPGPRSVHTAKWDRCVKEVRKRGTAADPYAVCTAAMGELAVRKPHRRTANPLPKVTAVRRIFYAVTATKGREKLYLKRSGKLTRAASGAARFSSVNEAIEHAKAHLKKYPTSRAFKFDVGLAY